MLNKIVKKIIKYRCLFIRNKFERQNKRLKLYNFYLNSVEDRRNKKRNSNRDFKIDQIHTKLSLHNDIFQFDNIKFYVPLYPLEHIQRDIVDNANFYEIRYLNYLDRYIDEGSNILDIGANIGNHSVYWAKVRNVNSVHCFEPIKSTFDILKKNIEINNISNKVKLYNLAVGSGKSSGTIDWYRQSAIGAAGIRESKNGEFEIVKLDDINFKERINFIKIDIEGFEVQALEGMSELLKRDMPVIAIESYGENIPKIILFLERLGYKSVGNLVYPLDFIFVPNK